MANIIRRFDIPNLSDQDREILRAGLTRGFADAAKQGIDLHDVSAKIIIDPKHVIPEFGIGGVPDPHNDRAIIIQIDPAKIRDAGFQDNLSRLVTHELNHVGRIAGCPKNRTLGDALVFEGLAQIAEVTAGHEPAFYSRFSSDAEMKKFAEHALRHVDDDLHFDTPEETYGQWFFGVKGDPQYPRHGGYKLGYALVSSYLTAKGLSPVDALHIKTSTIINAWKAGEITLANNRDASLLQQAFHGECQEPELNSSVLKPEKKAVVTPSL